jgi:hypothetical protein
MDGIAEVKQTEAECIRRFRVKAPEIRAPHPEPSPQIASARAVVCPKPPRNTSSHGKGC